MSYFKINIKDIKEAINEYKRSRKYIEEIINDTYLSLKNVDSGWNDDDAYSFIDTIKKDKLKINEYFSELDINYNNINKFIEKLEKICNKYNYNRTTNFLKFNNEKIGSIKNKISNAIEYLANAKRYLNYCNFDYDFEALSYVRKLENSITNKISELKSLLSYFANIDKEIINTINEYQNNLSKIKGIKLDLNLLEYNWKTTNFSINKTDMDMQKDLSAKSIKIDDFSNDIETDFTIDAKNSSDIKVTNMIVDEKVDYNVNYNNSKNTYISDMEKSEYNFNVNSVNNVKNVEIRDFTNDLESLVVQNYGNVKNSDGGIDEI